MDNKIIFVKTSKGEDEMLSKTKQLAGDVKRALLMVDGNASLGEISKRAAPSMRASLSEMFQELEKGGFIREQDKAKVKTKAGIDNIPKMSIPVKMATPKKHQPVDEDAGELDFMSGFAASPPEVPTAGAAKADQLRTEAEDKSGQAIEAEKIKALREAEAILLKAEQEAARIREETARRAQEEAEAIRLKAELEARLQLEAAARENQQAEAARIKAEQEAQLRLEAAIRENQQAEAARIKTEQEAMLRLEAAIRENQQAEAARIKTEQEAQLRLEAAAREKQQADAARIKAEQEAAQMRIELEMAKVRAELEAKARLEAAAMAERIAKQEQDAAMAREAAAREQAARTREAVSVEKPASFAFDTFQVDHPLYTSESHLGGQPAQKEKHPVQKAGPVKPAPVEKPGAFAFDTFQVDQPPYTSELPAKRQSAQNEKQSAQAGPAQQPVTAENTAQSIEARRPVKQQQITPPVAAKSDDGKPSPEQIQREIQVRKAVEERMAAEALEAKKMADAQAKAWAEAEQRAIEAARAEMEQVAKQATYAVDDIDIPAAKPAPVARVRREPFSWSKLTGLMIKLGLFLLVLFAGALFIIPYVMPMRDYLPKAEQMLSAKLHQPVHIGRLSGRILPMPRLELGEIYIGDAKQFQADEAKINFALIGLFTEEKPVNSIEFQGVKIRGAWVRSVSEWLQKMANEEKYPVSRMVINQGTLDADVFELTGIEGELDFDPDGKFTQSNLRASAGKYALAINVTPLGKLQAVITVHGSALPLLPNWTFDELTAKGEFNNNELVISDFDARILGGAVQGNASINWRSGWIAQGTLSAKTIAMQQVNHLLEGNAEGTARFKMAAKDMGGLADSAVLDGSFTARNGMISSMDIVETARKHSRENLPGGRTHFDGLGGVIAYANNAYHFKQVKVDAGVLNATATFDVTRQQLSGKMNVNLSMPDMAGPVELKIDGTIDSPTLRYAP
jgi:hypothetical protein